jgi:hypothetical protein
MLATLVPVLSGVGVAPATNSYFSIATQTIGSGGASSITFSSIPSTFTHLQIRSIARDPYSGTGDTFLRAQFNGDTGSNYVFHYLAGSGSSASSSNALSQSFAPIGDVSYDGDIANAFAAGVADILDYSNVNKYKTVRALAGGDFNGSGYVYLQSGLWMNTAAITSITISSYTNLKQYSSFALYGVK